MNTKKIVIVGAGPAGMMAAIRAGELNQDVTLVEKNSSPGKKLLLSGKGRCNLTNFCDLEPFLKRFSHNGAFLRDAFKKFFNRELMEFFEKRGLALKVERQLRVFPVSDSSNSVLEVLKKELKKRSVRFIFDRSVKGILTCAQAVAGVVLSDGARLTADRVVLATGGVSYPLTGSKGEGLEIARSLGHHIIPLRPGLVPLETKQQYCRKLEGLTLKNVRLTFCSGKKRRVSEIGELLFTHTGISGPLVLSISGTVADWLQENSVSVEIDLKPALSEERLDARILREFSLNPKKTIRNIFRQILPLRLIAVCLEILGIDPDKKVSQITQTERRKIVSLLKGLRLDITRTRPIEEAMVTRGGISMKDIDPRTMGSRVITGLYLAGEIMDVDGDTGGFNLQAAFSTGYLAGESAALH